MWSGCTCDLVAGLCSEHNRVTRGVNEVDNANGPSRKESIHVNLETQPTLTEKTAFYGTEADGNDPAFVRGLSPSKEQGSEAKKPIRTVISKEAKELFEQHFASDRYPAVVGIQNLAQKTNLTTKNVQMWFANKRSRTGRRKGMVSVMGANICVGFLYIHGFDC